VSDVPQVENLRDVYASRLFLPAPKHHPAVTRPGPIAQSGVSAASTSASGTVANDVA
jgi:hypothetical protein